MLKQVCDQPITAMMNLAVQCTAAFILLRCGFTVSYTLPNPSTRTKLQHQNGPVGGAHGFVSYQGQQGTLITSHKLKSGARTESPTLGLHQRVIRKVFSRKKNDQQSLKMAAVAILDDPSSTYQHVSPQGSGFHTPTLYSSPILEIIKDPSVVHEFAANELPSAMS